MKYSIISSILFAATAAALPQGWGQISRSVIVDNPTETGVVVPREAKAQRLGPVTRVTIVDSAQPTVLHVPREAEAEPQHLWTVTRVTIHDSPQPTVLHVPREAEAEPQHLWTVTRVTITDSPQPTVLHVPRVEAPLERRQTMGGTCVNDSGCSKGFYCAIFPSGISVCLPIGVQLPTLPSTGPKPGESATRTDVAEVPATSSSGITPTNVAIAERR